MALPEYTACAQDLAIPSSGTVYAMHIDAGRKLYVRQVRVTFKGVTATSGQPRVAVHRGVFGATGGTTVAVKNLLNTDMDEYASNAVVRTLPSLGTAPSANDLIDVGRYQAGVSITFPSPIVVQADEELVVAVAGDGTALSCDVTTYYVEAV